MPSHNICIVPDPTFSYDKSKTRLPPLHETHRQILFLSKLNNRPSHYLWIENAPYALPHRTSKHEFVCTDDNNVLVICLAADSPQQFYDIYHWPLVRQTDRVHAYLDWIIFVELGMVWMDNLLWIIGRLVNMYEEDHGQVVSVALSGGLAHGHREMGFMMFNGLFEYVIYRTCLIVCRKVTNNISQIEDRNAFENQILQRIIASV